MIWFLLLSCKTQDSKPGPTPDDSVGGTGDPCLTDCGDTGADSTPPDDTAADSETGAPDDTSGGDDTAPDDTAPDDTADDTAPDDTGTPPAPPRVILFIGDGMGVNHVASAGVYGYGVNGGTAMESLPYHGRLRTASRSGVTDSAAAATAMSSGVKTYNGRLGLDSDGVQVQNIREYARGLGMSTGLVSSDALTGATPAAFAAHIEDRASSADIAAQIAAIPPDVLFGGGRMSMDAALAALNAQRLSTRTDLLAWVDDGRPVFGLFADGTFPFVVDAVPDTPSLAEVTAAAIDKLTADPDGFFLMVEGARIDHASHANDERAVFPEILDFDNAVQTAIAWSANYPDATIIVTADHECGGMWFSGGALGVAPDASWRWGMHSNADVAVFAAGPQAAVFDGQRLDNTWVHSVLHASIDGTAPVNSGPGLLADGYTDDLGAPVTAQLWETDFGITYNQLDALRITATADGIFIGVDGVFEFSENLVSVLIDMDYGAGTGLGQDATLVDTTGALDAALSTIGAAVATTDPALGFDLISGSIGAAEVGLDVTGFDWSGLRGLSGQWGDPANLWWLDSITNFDDGNVSDYGPANSGPAADAGLPGLTEGGYEIFIPWSSAYPQGIPAAGASIAVVAVLSDSTGMDISNQVLPPLPTEDGIDGGTLTITQSVVLDIDATGAATGPGYLYP